MRELVCATGKQETFGAPHELCMPHRQQFAAGVLSQDAGICAAGKTKPEAITRYILLIDDCAAEYSAKAQYELHASCCSIWTRRVDANHPARVDQDRPAEICVVI